MAGFRTKQKRPLRQAVRRKVERKPTVTTNKAGGMAFDYTDPAEYLLGTIGAATFNEPKYYSQSAIDRRKYKRFTGINVQGLDEQAVKIVEASRQVAQGRNPRDLLALAHWARKELNMRTTPQVMLAVAAREMQPKDFVREYVGKIATRPDDLLQLVAAYESLYGWGQFPASLKKGIADALSRVDEYGFLKYETDGHPNFKDLLLFVDRKRDWPVTKPVFEYLVNGNIIDPAKTPVFAARKELARSNRWTARTPKLLERSRATWEVAISQFGNKPEVWEALIANRLLPYMATLRNLSNMLDVGVSKGVMREVARRIADREQVLKSKQLPFRFHTAWRNLFPDEKILRRTTYVLTPDREKAMRKRAVWDQMTLSMLGDALEAALDHSVDNLPALTGPTVIAYDHSGSMRQAVSGKSVVTIAEIATLMAAIGYRMCDEAYIAGFASNVTWQRLSRRNTVLSNAMALRSDGGATYTHRVPQEMLAKRIMADRLILISDMQSYGQSGWGFNATDLPEAVELYRRQVNPNLFVHSIDLVGLGTKSLDDGLTNTIGGFSEKIFGQIANFEDARLGERTSRSVKRSLPTLQYVRENY